MSEVTPTPKLRWRPRFSLRTLMIGVLLVAFLWTATVVWGVPAVRIQLMSPQAPTLKGYSIAPFIVTLHADGDNWRYNGTWFWFFGYTKAFSQEQIVFE